MNKKGFTLVEAALALIIVFLIQSLLIFGLNFFKSTKDLSQTTFIDEAIFRQQMDQYLKEENIKNVTRDRLTTRPKNEEKEVYYENCLSCPSGVQIRRRSNLGGHEYLLGKSFKLEFNQVGQTVILEGLRMEGSREKDFYYENNMD